LISKQEILVRAAPTIGSPSVYHEIRGKVKNCMALTPGCARSAWRRPPGWRTGRRHAFGDPCRCIAEARGEDDEVDDLGRVGAARHGEADPGPVVPLGCETRGPHAQTVKASAGHRSAHGASISRRRPISSTTSSCPNGATICT